MKLFNYYFLLAFCLLAACSSELNDEEKEIPQTDSSEETISIPPNPVKKLQTQILGKTFFPAHPEKCQPAGDIWDAAPDLSFYEDGHFDYHEFHLGEGELQYTGTYEVTQHNIRLQFNEVTKITFPLDLPEGGGDASLAKNEVIREEWIFNWQLCEDGNLIIRVHNPRDEPKEVSMNYHWILSALEARYAGTYKNTESFEEMKIDGYGNYQSVAQDGGKSLSLRINYRSPSQPLWQALEISEFHSEDSSAIVTFGQDPNNTQYQLQFYPQENKLTCLNPDSSLQTFHLQK